MRVAVGWQDRDWAKWTDEERRRFVGGGGGGSRSVGMAPGAFLGVVVGLVAIVMLNHPFTAHRTSPPPVYGTGVVQMLWGQRTTCTEMDVQATTWTCKTWSILLHGQQVRRAAPLPAGSLCHTAVVDQASKRWICATTS